MTNVIFDITKALGQTPSSAVLLTGKDGKMYLHALLDKSLVATAKNVTWTDDDGFGKYPSQLKASNGGVHHFAGVALAPDKTPPATPNASQVVTIK